MRKPLRKTTERKTGHEVLVQGKANRRIRKHLVSSAKKVSWYKLKFLTRQKNCQKHEIYRTFLKLKLFVKDGVFNNIMILAEKHFVIMTRGTGLKFSS